MKKLEDLKYVVRLSEVSKIFGSDEHKTVALQNVSCEASAGELVLLLGPSGSGKTTLLTLIAGLLRPSSGTISLFGKNIESYSAKMLQQIRAMRIGFIFQTFLLIDSLTVQENVGVVLRFNGKTRREAHRHAFRLLEQFRIEHLAKKFPRTLSQGEKQRVAVARAIANEGDLIIADEPTGCLESKQGFEIIQLLKTYSKDQNRCVIVGSHDLRIEEFADRILRLEDGILRESA
ncbi:MAG: ATP-binding cassette domain-containing protein [Candidatus Aminicenantes bacterium]|nr:ATP-binding cassette domain-containing protein [Candidatus Aminicenantes bacterium]